MQIGGFEEVNVIPKDCAEIKSRRYPDDGRFRKRTLRKKPLFWECSLADSPQLQLCGIGDDEIYRRANPCLRLGSRDQARATAEACRQEGENGRL